MPVVEDKLTTMSTNLDNEYTSWRFWGRTAKTDRERFILTSETSFPPETRLEGSSRERISKKWCSKQDILENDCRSSRPSWHQPVSDQCFWLTLQDKPKSYVVISNRYQISKCLSTSINSSWMDRCLVLSWEVIPHMALRSLLFMDERRNTVKS